jgi:hypothetical protein
MIAQSDNGPVVHTPGCGDALCDACALPCWFAFTQPLSAGPTQHATRHTLHMQRECRSRGRAAHEQKEGV